jgi:hypothetical protein
LFDSLYFIRESSLEYVPDSRIIQLYGAKRDFDLNAPTPVIWGVGLILPDSQFEVVSAGADKEASILSAAKQYIKYSDAGTFPASEYELWMTKTGFVSHRASLSQEDRQEHQLSEEAKSWLINIREENAKKIHKAFSDLSKSDTQTVLELIAPMLDEYYSEGDHEYDPQQITTVQNALWAHGPVRGQQLYTLYQLLVKNYVWRLRVPGVTAFSFPSAYLGEHEILLPATCRQSVTVGSKVTDIRYPNTGTGMIPVSVAGFCPLPVVVGNPIAGKKWQNEDYDGDVSVVVFRELIENRDWVDPVPKVPEVGDHSALTQVLYASFSKLAIGLADYQVSRSIISKSEQAWELSRNQAQIIVDMAKKFVDVSLLSYDVEFPNNADPAAEFVRLKKLDSKLIEACRRKPKGLYGRAVAALPIVLWEESWGWISKASLNSQLIRERLSMVFNDALHGKGVKELKRALSLQLLYSIWHSSHGDDTRYRVIGNAKEMILADPIGWEEAMKINLLLNAGLVLDPHSVLTGLNALAKVTGKRVALFGKGTSYKVQWDQPLGPK